MAVQLISNYAQIGDDDCVLQIKSVVDDSERSELAGQQYCESTYGGRWIKTAEGIRGNLAEVGYIYDSMHDVFYPPSPGSSWLLDTSNWTWVQFA